MKDLKKSYSHNQEALKKLLDHLKTYQIISTDSCPFIKNLLAKTSLTKAILLSNVCSAIEYRLVHCVDLTWKYLKDLLIIGMKQNIQLISPKPIVKESTLAGLITEEEAEALLEIIDYRNNSSHRYKEEVAEIIHNQAPAYHSILKTILDKNAPKLRT